MIKGIRKEYGLGEPPRQFTTNRVESINQLLKLETNKEQKDVYAFKKCMEDAVKCQQRNVEWAVIGMMINF